ncbi:disulfide oxidoreductase [Sporosarcina gallistercoris]|uniref:Disulfide bond formation protein B n=1 Tax=Sporosarcina gallistercoris TaxID=2762245 RepID=A0ABR8PLB9_9BACL|nr:disulfide oxidoreductase [Sporosarcina gallistercoris]MBD7908972.1 disulfide bond formation protein B [Sporosarcina gallistercoris]
MNKRVENLLLLIWTIAFVATLGSLYYSEVKGFTPCLYCWYQRILMYPIVLIAGIALIQKNGRIWLTTAAFSIIGACLSGYHYTIQKFSFFQERAGTCGDVPCTAQYVNYLGFITIPFMAFIAFVLILIASVMMSKQLKETK